MTDKISLLPCPFCGSEAQSDDGFAPCESITYAWCSNRDCPLHPMDSFGFTPEAWNTRSALSALVQQQEGLKLPDFIRRDVERAIEEAVHPKGMAVHDGIARIGADRLSIMLKVIDNPAPADALVEALAKLLPTLDDALEDLEIWGRHSDQGYRKLKDWYRKIALATKDIDAALAAARVKP